MNDCQYLFLEFLGWNFCINGGTKIINSLCLKWASSVLIYKAIVTDIKVCHVILGANEIICWCMIKAASLFLNVNSCSRLWSFSRTSHTHTEEGHINRLTSLWPYLDFPTLFFAPREKLPLVPHKITGNIIQPWKFLSTVWSGPAQAQVCGFSENENKAC